MEESFEVKKKRLFNVMLDISKEYQEGKENEIYIDLELVEYLIDNFGVKENALSNEERLMGNFMGMNLYYKPDLVGRKKK